MIKLQLMLKRLIDILGSLIGIIVLSPVYVIVGILVYLKYSNFLVHSVNSLFNLNVSAENIQINENSIYSKSRKEIIELQDKIKLEEKNLNILTNSIKNSTQNYIEKIISLQNQLLNSPKGDIISLEEANKIDDVQVNNLLDTLYRVNDEYEREKEEINNLSTTSNFFLISSGIVFPLYFIRSFFKF